MKIKITNTIVYNMTKEDEKIILQYAKANNISLNEAIEKLQYEEEDYNFIQEYKENEPVDVSETVEIN